MKTYYMYRCVRTGRVILDDMIPENVTPILEIQAKSWIEARDKIDTSNFEYVEGHGWF